MIYVISIIILLISVTVHEFAHAFMANKRGDTTGHKLGRLSLNPFVHVDPFGSIALPILLILTHSPVLFAWAKPIPIDFSQLRNPKKDMMWIGLAGPAANLLLAVVASLILKVTMKESYIFHGIVSYVMILNVVLAVFNLMPIPPLDGSRIVMGLIPLRMAVKVAMLEPYGFILIIGLIFLGLFDHVIWPLAAFILKILI
jgi:Zn-dependent protease